MKTRKMWLLFFGVKGMILLAPLSFVAVHYMVTGAGGQLGTAGVDTFENGLTKLMYAAQRNDLSAAQDLVYKKGANLDLQAESLAPNYKDAQGNPKIDGRTALGMACSTLDNPTAEKIVRLLVNAGADVRIKGRALGESVLHNATYYTTTLDDRLSPIIELMVKNGADINARNDNGNTIVHYAIDKPRRDWLENFLSGRFGALVDRTVKNNEGKDARAYAETWHSELLDYFKKPAPVIALTQRDQNGLTGLMIAAIRGNADVLRTVPMGAAVLNERTIETGQDKYGYTALELAILHQRPELVAVLMERGADPNVKDARGNAPLHLVYKLKSSSDRTMVIDALLGQVDEPSSKRQKLSPDKVPDLNIQDARGNTLMHLAVMRNDEAMVRFLLEKYRTKINFGAKNSAGDTPGQIAKSRGYTAIQTILGA